MAEPEIIPIPRPIVERALALGERDVAATEALRDEVAAYRAEVRPIVDAYGAEMKARTDARARADADRLEGLTAIEKGRGEIVKFLTSPLMIVVITTVTVATINYFLGLAGIAPPEIRAALAPEAADVAPKH